MSREPERPPAQDLAVALHYSGEGAPTVTARGRGETAARIRELAEEHDVPNYQNAELAQLLARVDLGDEIPEALFAAVAEVIAFAYSLRGRAVPQPEPAPAASGAASP